VLGGGGLVGWRVATGPHPLKDEAFRTAVGRPQTVKLPDGSEVTLNTDTVLRTRADKDRRLVYLERGQAFFKVAHDQRHPFVVTAAGRTVTALGTAFDVRVDNGAFTVTLVEGKVRVEEPVPAKPAAKGPQRAVNFEATEMTAGSRLVATAQEPWRVTSANVVVDTSWTRDILIFDNQPLVAVVAELNRYSDKKIVIADPTIEKTPISGTFRPGDVDSFVRTIEAYRLARAGENTPLAIDLQAY
ncbi:MAG: FecR family protein, partial [bacterium]